MGVVGVASLRALNGDFIAGAALLSCCAGALVSAALCEEVDAVVDAIVVAGAGARNFMDGARSAPTRSRAVKVASGICASMCD